jgi:hypothetical protein
MDIPCSSLYNDYLVASDFNAYYPSWTSNKIDAPNGDIIGGTNSVIFQAYFYNNSIGAGFNYNSIGANFYINSIGANFYNNSIGANFYYNTGILDNFQYNTVETCQSIDFTTATYVYFSYSKTLFKTSGGLYKLRYFNDLGVPVVVNAND